MIKDTKNSKRPPKFSEKVTLQYQHFCRITFIQYLFFILLSTIYSNFKNLFTAFDLKVSSPFNCKSSQLARSVKTTINIINQFCSFILSRRDTCNKNFHQKVFRWTETASKSLTRRAENKLNVLFKMQVRIWFQMKTFPFTTLETFPLCVHTTQSHCHYFSQLPFLFPFFTTLHPLQIKTLLSFRPTIFVQGIRKERKEMKDDICIIFESMTKKLRIRMKQREKKKK